MFNFSGQFSWLFSSVLFAARGCFVLSGTLGQGLVLVGRVDVMNNLLNIIFSMELFFIWYMYQWLHDFSETASLLCGFLAETEVCTTCCMYVPGAFFFSNYT